MLKLWWMATVGVVSVASGGETLFTSGPREYEGRSYYWLAKWKLEVTLPPDTAPTDRVEVLFGSKGASKRLLCYEYGGKKQSLSHTRDKSGYDWLALPLGRLTAGEKFILYGEGRLIHCE